LIAKHLYLSLGNWHTMMCRMPNREDLPHRAKGKKVSVHKVASNAKPRLAKSSMGLGDSSKVAAVRRGIEAGMYQWLKESLDVSDQRLSSAGVKHHPGNGNEMGNGKTKRGARSS
jgi:hypothetical protein